jgi:hypothetical protein
MGKTNDEKEVVMNFLGHKSRLWIEGFCLLVAAAMVILAIVDWACEFTWRFNTTTYIFIAGIALLAAIYLVLDEIRLRKLP